MTNKNETGCVVLGDTLLFEDGTIRENSQNKFAVTKQPPTDPYELAKLKCLYYERKMELHIEEFDQKKSEWLAVSRNQLRSEANPGGPCVSESEAVGFLNALKRKIEHCRSQLNHWESEKQKNEPTTTIKQKSITEQNRANIGSLINTIESIEI